MAPMPIYRFVDHLENIITYNFDPKLREEGGDGPVSLERVSNTKDAFKNVGSNLIVYPEPNPGDEFYRYTANDGGDVRYQYDPGSRNGKDYVVAIHRGPANYKRLMEEDLSVKSNRDPFKETQAQTRGEPHATGVGQENLNEKRRDSAMQVD